MAVGAEEKMVGLQEFPGMTQGRPTNSESSTGSLHHPDCRRTPSKGPSDRIGCVQ